MPLPALSPATAQRWLRYSVAFVWFWTILSTGVFSLDEGKALLDQAGIHGSLNTALVWTSLGWELLLGTLVLWGRRWTRLLCLVQGATIVFFTGYITLSPGLRALWVHPFAPVAKNIPILGALAMLYALGDPEKK
ncbi:MAG: DoxX-like family protein [Deltaproteobacteria bacterium]|nr:DoxX-like family protein [Deltaproteobacteria bacterium]